MVTARAPRRRSTTLLLEVALVEEARRRSLDLSRLLEDRLREMLTAEPGRQWLEENQVSRRFEVFRNPISAV